MDPMYDSSIDPAQAATAYCASSEISVPSGSVRLSTFWSAACQGAYSILRPESAYVALISSPPIFGCSMSFFRSAPLISYVVRTSSVVTLRRLKRSAREMSP